MLIIGGRRIISEVVATFQFPAPPTFGKSQIDQAFFLGTDPTGYHKNLRIAMIRAQSQGERRTTRSFTNSLSPDLVMGRKRYGNQKFRLAGFAAEEAMKPGGRRRLRPITITALARNCSMLPLALAQGAGSQMLQPLAIAVIGGILISMALSLVITPTVHFYLTRNEVHAWSQQLVDAIQPDPANVKTTT